MNTTTKYQYTAEMREISGFGGGYEKACRDMVVAGIEYWDAHPQLDPQFHGWKGVTGIIAEDNEDAKTLSRIVVDSTGGDCTGAMHHAAINHIFFIYANGWDKYVEEMTPNKN